MGEADTSEIPDSFSFTSHHGLLTQVGFNLVSFERSQEGLRDSDEEPVSYIHMETHTFICSLMIIGQWIFCASPYT